MESDVRTIPDVDEETLVLAGFTEGVFFAERYRIEALLGSGAMGKVFRATDTRANLPVALKVLHPEKARKDQVIARFRREAEIMVELGHPNVVRILESGRSPDGIDYLVMELLDGRTLREQLRERGAMSPEEVWAFVEPVADALGAAHQKGIVHRDLKPDNVFLLAGGGVKVVDFGLSLLDVDKRMTRTGVMLGTPRYMAPEQIRSAKDVDPRVDVYALGVMVHEALTNASPFPATDAGQLLGCVMQGNVTRLEEQRPDLPPGLAEVVRRAMARDRSDRFATMGAFSDAFARVLGLPGARRGKGRIPADRPSGDPAPPSEAVSIPPAQDKPRFTVPESAPTSAPAKRAAPKPRRRGLLIALFVLAVVAVACVSGTLAFGVRGLLSP